MYLPKFSMDRPESSEEAATLLKVREESQLVAGGTELFPRMKYGLCSPRTIVSLKGSRAYEPRISEEGMLILDARMSLTAVNNALDVKERAPLLAMAAGRVATREIRNMGTLGGNLCQESRCLYYNQKHTFQFREPCYKRGGDQCYFVPGGNKCWAVFMSDVAPALICLNASLNIVGSGGVRQMGVDALYTHDPLAPVSLKRDELITKVLIPKSEGFTGSGFAKFTMRGGIEFAAVNVGVFMETQDDLKTCKSARVTVGAVSGGPQRAQEAESFLKGNVMTDDAIQTASEKTAQGVKIFPHHGYSKGYLSECLKIQTRTALEDALENISGATGEN